MSIAPEHAANRAETPPTPAASVDRLLHQALAALGKKERLAALTAQAHKLREKAGTSAPSPESVGRRQRRRQLSAAARKRISEGMRRRWAERKKGKS